LYVVQTTLTLRLDDAVIRRAKTGARGRGTSLSAAVAAFFAQLPVDTEEPDESVPRPGPRTRRLVGVAGPAPRDGSGAEVRRWQRDHLERKHA
jgi:hypothetical protein